MTQVVTYDDPIEYSSSYIPVVFPGIFLLRTFFNKSFYLTA